MVSIIPAILSHNITDLKAKMAAVTPFSDHVHIDIMDGIFVANKTITGKDLRGVETPLKLEAHLMVETPEIWIQDLVYAKCKKIIVHQEIGLSLRGVLQTIKGMGLLSGVALNPDTEINKISELWEHIDTVQLMGVVPGHYGATFQSNTVAKATQLREAGFLGTVQVDGGVTPENILMLKRSGVSNFVVGHYLFGSEEAPDFGNMDEKLKLLRTALGTP